MTIIEKNLTLFNEIRLLKGYWWSKLEFRQNYAPCLEAYTESCKMAKMELSFKIVNSFQPFTILSYVLSYMFDKVLNTALFPTFLISKY